MGRNIWARRSTRIGVIAAIVLILAAGLGSWYLRATRNTEATSLQAAATPATAEHKQLAHTGSLTPTKPGGTAHSMQKQSAKETAEHEH